MPILQALIAAAVLTFFVYLLMPSRKPKQPAQSSRNARKNRAKQVGMMTGLMDGDMEDGMIAQHALDRAQSDPADSTNRDIAAAVAMQKAQSGE